MTDIVSQILIYLHGIWRRRWYVIAVAWFVCGAGWTGVASLPDRYEASARLYADMDTMLNPLMRGMAVEMNLFQQLDVLQRTLLSRPNLEKVVLMTDLDLQVHTDVEKEALLDRLGKSIILKQQSRNLFHIGYEDADPQLAKRVVQAILQIFVESSLGASRQDMDATRRFLDSQIREAEQHLTEVEAKLTQFKREKMSYLPGEGNYYSNLQRLSQAVSKTQSEIAEGEMMRDELRQQLAAVPQFLELQTAEQAAMEGGPGRGPESDIQIRIFDMEKTIDSLLMRYTDKHPDVLIAKKRVEQLKKEQEEEKKTRLAAFAGPGGDSEATNAGGPSPRAGPGKSLVPNPLHEKIKLQLVQHEAALAAVKRRLQDSQAEHEKWTKMASLVPEVEAELARLNRDYAIVKTNYDQLRQRQESARMARDLETKAQKVQYRIIDPPKVPLKPSAPKRPLLLAGVLFVGLGAGAAFAFLLTQLNQTYSTVARLRDAFTLPVLGSITVITSPAERWRRLRELAGFSLVTCTLFAAFIGLVAIETIGPSTIVGYVKGLGLDYLTALLGLA